MYRVRCTAIDSNEVATNRARREYDNYLNSQYEALINSEELTDEQRDILANTWGDGNVHCVLKATSTTACGIHAWSSSHVHRRMARLCLTTTLSSTWITAQMN